MQTYCNVINSNNDFEGVATQKDQVWRSYTKINDKFMAKVQKFGENNPGQSMRDLSLDMEVAEKTVRTCEAMGKGHLSCRLIEYPATPPESPGSGFSTTSLASPYLTCGLQTHLTST